MTSTLEIQKRLIARGYSVGKAGPDGIMGNDTKAALKKAVLLLTSLLGVNWLFFNNS